MGFPETPTRNPHNALPPTNRDINNPKSYIQKSEFGKKDIPETPISFCLG